MGNIASPGVDFGVRLKKIRYLKEFKLAILIIAVMSTMREEQLKKAVIKIDRKQKWLKCLLEEVDFIRKFQTDQRLLNWLHMLRKNIEKQIFSSDMGMLQCLEELEKLENTM